MLTKFLLKIPDECRIEDSETQVQSFIVISKDADTARTYFPTLHVDSQTVIMAKQVDGKMHWFHSWRFDDSNLMCMDSYAAIRWIPADQIAQISATAIGSAEHGEGAILDLFYH